MKPARVAVLLIGLLAVTPSWAQNAPIGPGGGPGSGGGGGSPGGATGTVQYKSGASTFGGITDWTTSGVTDLTGTAGSTLTVNGCTIGSNIFCVGGTSASISFDGTNNIANFNLGTGANANFQINYNAAAAATVPHENSIHITGDNNQLAALYIDSFGTTGAGAGIRSIENLRAARGTATSPTAMQQWDEVARWSGRAYGTTGFSGSLAAFSVVAAQNITDTAQGSFACIRTTALNTAGGGTSSAPPCVVGFTPNGGLVVGPSFFTYNTNTNTQLVSDPGAGAINASASVTIGAGSAITSSGPGGALGSNAFTSTAYAPLASPTFTGTVTMPDAGTWGSGGINSSAIGATGASTGAFTTLSASSTVSGTGFSTYLASPPAIGGSAAAAGTFTTLNATTLTMSGNIISSGTITTSGTNSQSLTAANQSGANNGPLVQVKAGNNTQASGSNNGGAVNITAGNASGAGSTGNGGNVVVTAGTSVGGTAGNIQLASASSITNATDATSTATGALQVAGGAVVIKRFWIPGITPSSGLQTAVLCQSSGGEMIADSVACLASGRQFKNIIGPVSDGALTKLVKLPIDVWRYKAEGKFTSPEWTRERIGPIAQDVAAMDSHLAGYDEAGNVRTYSTEQLLAFTIKALQELDGKFEDYRRAHP
jgi:hypothetical protein